MKSVLVIADYKGWAFENIYNGLKTNLINWHVEVFYQFSKSNKLSKKLKDYDLILYLCDFDLTFLIKNKIPKEKVILAIRSNVTAPIYNSPSIIKSLAGTIAASNKSIYDKFSKEYDNVYLLPGGVDTERFVYTKKIPGNPVIVGWAGSRDNFGSEYRGLSLLEESCKSIGAIFNPALREVKYRTHYEMVKYYNEEIDIYADVSIAAGRQNGIIEAGSCGRPVLSTRAGISENLLGNNEYGILVDRDKKSISDAIKLLISNYDDYSVKISRRIDDLYSWKYQSKLFENCFNEVINV